MIASLRDRIDNARKSTWRTKEQWEKVVLEMPEYEYVDPVMMAKCAKKLNMSYPIFWKWYNVWIASGKDTKSLPFIKTEAEIRANDKRGNRETSERVSDLPKIPWN